MMTAKRIATGAALALCLTQNGWTQQPPAPGPIGAAAGTGPYPAIAEARAEAGAYTIFRPAALPAENLPIVLWGNGGCSDNGMSASRMLREIASHGYLVIANGRPGQEFAQAAAVPDAAEAPPAPPRASTTPPADRAPDATTTEGMLAAIDWAVAANADPASDLYGHVDTGRVAAMGHSCGGLQALHAGSDPRIDTVVAFNSGVYIVPRAGLSGVPVDKDDLNSLHTPVAYFLGGPSDIAYGNGVDDFEKIGHVPVMMAELPVGHGGTFSVPNGGDWGRVAVAWLDWQIKADQDAGRWFVGEDCILCTTYGWTVARKNFPDAP